MERVHNILCNTLCVADLPKQVCVLNVNTAALGDLQALMCSDSCHRPLQLV